FQAEDGIRDFHVTVVQTCALPISVSNKVSNFITYTPGLCRSDSRLPSLCSLSYFKQTSLMKKLNIVHVSCFVTILFCCSCNDIRSEERRVGKECRSKLWPSHEDKR